LADAGPGVLLPDAAVTIAGSDRRIRRMAREGMMLLLGDSVDAASIQTLVLDNCTAPVSILKISDIDPAGSLQFQLKSSTHDVWIIRPDAYIAAVCDAHDPEGIAAALHRAITDTTSLEPQPGLTRSLIISGALPHPV
jgi:pentachlorophenol monooxygenase/3-(3-hydroxy-phenyl)propionate hydroxylase